MLGENNYSSFELGHNVEPASCVHQTGAVEVTVAFEAEFTNAEDVSSALLSEIHDAYGDLRIGKNISLDKLSALLVQTASSLQKNPYVWFFLCQNRNRQSYLVEHAFRTSVYAMAIALRIGQNTQQISQLGLAALLSDVGKIMIPDSILDKEGALSSAEYAVIRVHPLEGRKILQNQSDASIDVIDVVLSHHERIDGQGYPAGVEGAEISLAARIVAIADAYDAMTCERAYARARSVKDSLDILWSCRGKQFDSTLIEAFTALVGELPSGGVVILNNGLEACVLEPVAMTCTDQSYKLMRIDPLEGQGADIGVDGGSDVCVDVGADVVIDCIIEAPLSSLEAQNDGAKFNLPCEQTHLAYRRRLRQLAN